MNRDEWLAWIDALCFLRLTPPWQQTGYDPEIYDFVSEWYRALAEYGKEAFDASERA